MNKIYPKSNAFFFLKVQYALQLLVAWPGNGGMQGMVAVQQFSFSGVQGRMAKLTEMSSDMTSFA